MSNSDLVRKYFSAYENKVRKAVESLLTDDFVFTSPYDYRIDRETYFKRCWPYSEKVQFMAIEKLFEKGQRSLCSLRLQDQKWRRLPEHGILDYRRKQDGRGLLWFCSKGTSINNDHRNLRCGQIARVSDIRLSDPPITTQERPPIFSFQDRLPANAVGWLA